MCTKITTKSVLYQTLQLDVPKDDTQVITKNIKRYKNTVFTPYHQKGKTTKDPVKGAAF